MVNVSACTHVMILTLFIACPGVVYGCAEMLTVAQRTVLTDNLEPPPLSVVIGSLFTNILRLPASATIIDLTPTAHRPNITLWLASGGSASPVVHSVVCSVTWGLFRCNFRRSHSSPAGSLTRKYCRCMRGSGLIEGICCLF